MAKFLTRGKTVSELEDLIQNAGEKLILISPYLKMSEDFFERLERRDKQNRSTTIIYKENQLDSIHLERLGKLRFVLLMSYDKLHAKCYYTDNKMIITSLNILEYSMANNKEMGVLIERTVAEDKKLFEEALAEANLIVENSKPSGIGAVHPIYKNQERKNSPNITSHYGFCIRTGVPIQFNPEKPLCYDAFLIWNKYGDTDYPEQFCHFSGEPSNGQTSVGFPILNKNWKKAKQTFNL
jgi:phosphatidylserine/phosphatidylglycerophosphate/cardiolipin synthase-like enzyme